MSEQNNAVNSLAHTKIGKNMKAIKEYIADQLKKDMESDQLSIYDPRDPFMGSK